MREVSGIHVFPNISENLNRSLFKIKSVMLGMAVSRSIAAHQAAREVQADQEASAAEEYLVQTTPVVPLVKLAEAEGCDTENLENGNSAPGKSERKDITPVVSASPARQANIRDKRI